MGLRVLRRDYQPYRRNDYNSKVHLEGPINFGKSGRTPKGPRNVRQIYLGTADTLFEKLSRPCSPLKSFPFGTAAAFLHAGEGTGLLAALQRSFPDGSRGLSVARLLFLQIVGRVEKPLSRAGMAEWFRTSSLPFLWNVSEGPSAQVLRRHLRDLFEVVGKDGEPALSRAAVHRLEGEIFRTLVHRGIAPRWMLYDGTNFFTYHQGDRWFQRGHSKEKRYDRNLVGLGMVTAGNLPVLTEVAPGNEGESKTFARIFDAFVQRLIDLEVATERLTLVFDRGINSTENFDLVRDAMHVIAALNRQQARRLLRIPLARFEEVARDGAGEPILGVEATWRGFERDWRVLVTYRKGTAGHQAKVWADRKAKVRSVVGTLRQHPKRTEKAVWRELTKQIPEEFQSCFVLGVERQGPGWVPRAEVDPKAEQALERSFGKTAIITDLSTSELASAELVEGFVARSEIEDDWKWLKDRHVISVKPVWVWNEAAVPGHVFLCVMGLLMLRYLQWELRELGLTMKGLLKALEGIRVVLVQGADGRPQLVLEQMEGESARVFSKLNLGRWIPNMEGSPA